MNKHTSGTEFYGTSSNFALLSQLLSKARSRLSILSYGNRSVIPNGQTNNDGSNSRTSRKEQMISSSSAMQSGTTNDETRKVLKDKLSIVNLLFDEDSAVQDSAPPSRAKTPSPRESEDRDNSTIQHSVSATKTLQNSDLEPNNHFHPDVSPLGAEQGHGKSSASLKNEIVECRLVENLLEKEYMRIFFDNLHYIHPFLSPTVFALRCERDVWEKVDHHRLQKHQLHFFALYNAVIAVGALTAGTDLLTNLRCRLGTERAHKRVNHEWVVPSSVDLSKIYFRRAKKFLGDYFEVCSLESVQALILMVIPTLCLC